MESHTWAEPKCWDSLFKKKKSCFYSRHDQGSLRICLFQCHTWLWLCLSYSCCGEGALEWGCIWESKGTLLLFCWPFLKISNSQTKKIIGFPSMLLGGKGSSLQHWELPQHYSNWDYLRREAAILLSPNFCAVLRPDKHKESSKGRLFLLLSRVVIIIFKPLKFEEGMWSLRRECGKGQDGAGSLRGDLQMQSRPGKSILILEGWCTPAVKRVW